MRLDWLPVKRFPEEGILSTAKARDCSICVHYRVYNSESDIS